jgi:hypothetical protein
MHKASSLATNQDNQLMLFLEYDTFLGTVLVCFCINSYTDPSLAVWNNPIFVYVLCLDYVIILQVHRK